MYQKLARRDKNVNYPKESMNQWTYQGKPFTEAEAEGFEAFVYVITRTDTGKRYVGKKILRRKLTRPPLKGKTKKRHYRVASDWPVYWGSNKTLLEEIETLGEALFTREVVRLCQTRGESSYYEAKIQFAEDAILSDGWYNDQIMIRVHRSHIKKSVKRDSS